MTSWKLISTKNSTFDWWSIVHFGFYSFAGSALEAGLRLNERGYGWVHLAWFIPLSLGWEVSEMWAERRWPEKWSNKLEHWSNRWIGDQVANTLGALLGVWLVGQ